jgi:nucleotide-binding universal stress UspA family protein
MATMESVIGISLKNILFLTDFSAPSEAALPYAVSIARAYSAKIHALHVFSLPACVYSTPEVTAAAIDAEQDRANSEIQRLESQLDGVEYDTAIERDITVWDAVKSAIRDRHIDLVVAGTHGRTGASKFFLGSVAEEVFRLSPVPVLTIGPSVRSSAHAAGKFHHILFATDYSSASGAAAPYAYALAKENQAGLLLLHVVRRSAARGAHPEPRLEHSVAEAMHRLYESSPKNMEMQSPPETLVDFGDPGERIVAVARERGADLIVLGLHELKSSVTAAVHLENSTAYKVVANANCPVLTVRL